MRIKCRKKEKPRTHFAYRGSLLAWENGIELFWTRVQIQGQNKRPERKLAPGPSLMVPVVGVEPTRYRYHWILSYSSHSEPNGLNRNKTVFSVTFQNIKNPKKPYKISIFDAKHQKYKQFVPSSIIGSQIPNLRRWRDVGGM